MTHIPDDLMLESDIVFNTNPTRPLTLHLLRPRAEADVPRPLVVWIFGGAFMMGDKNSGLPHLIPLAQRGYACAALEYRYSSEALFPAQIEDCKCGIRFLRAHSQQYNLDPNRIGVWGPSAGGHLSAMLGTTGDVSKLEGSGGWGETSSHVQAVCDFYGPTDFLAMDRAGSKQHHDAPDSPESKLIGGPIQEHPDLAARANPITYIAAAPKLPPFLVVHGDADPLVPFDQSERLVAALEHVNANVTFQRIAGAGHGGPEFETAEIVGLVHGFFDSHLRA